MTILTNELSDDVDGELSDGKLGNSCLSPDGSVCWLPPRLPLLWFRTCSLISLLLGVFQEMILTPSTVTPDHTRITTVAVVQVQSAIMTIDDDLLELMRQPGS